MDREQTLGRYFLVTETLLPADAEAEGWAIREPHVFQRVLLDMLMGGVWEQHLDRNKVAYEQLPDEALTTLLQWAEWILVNGQHRAEECYYKSQAWRGKA